MKYTGKILGLFGQSFRSYKHCKVVALNTKGVKNGTTSGYLAWCSAL